MGFAPPPRGGFAFIAAPERQSARDLSYRLGGGRYICRMAIYPEPGGQAVCQVVIPCTRSSENAARANFLEIRKAEVRRIFLPRTPVNKAPGNAPNLVGWHHGWYRPIGRMHVGKEE